MAAKKAKVTQVSRLTDVEKAIIALDARLAALEAHNAVMVKAFRKSANDIRPLYGLGGFAVALDAIADGIEQK